eukprot:5920784-Pleurochrysis_carterae.AAC.3
MSPTPSLCSRAGSSTARTDQRERTSTHSRRPCPCVLCVRDLPDRPFARSPPPFCQRAAAALPARCRCSASTPPLLPSLLEVRTSQLGRAQHAVGVWAAETSKRATARAMMDTSPPPQLHYRRRARHLPLCTARAEPLDPSVDWLRLLASAYSIGAGGAGPRGSVLAASIAVTDSQRGLSSADQHISIS